MSQQSDGGAVPQWDVADRMRKALRQAGIGVGEIAEYLGVTPGTVSTWINGRIEPSRQTLRLWAIRCGVDYGWLSGGDLPQPASKSPTIRVGIIKGERRALFGLAA